jgi:hypothetical protein
MKIVLLVLFTVTLFLWLLVLLGAFPGLVAHSGWLPWFATLFLGLAVFVEWKAAVRA